jgi:hypothetical protein
MCVLHEPLLHIDAEPESVDAERDDGEEEPLYVVAEKLSARAVEYQPVSVNESVLGNPFFLHADCPRSAYSKRDEAEQGLQDADADESEKTACEFGFHKMPSFA